MGVRSRTLLLPIFESVSDTILLLLMKPEHLRLYCLVFSFVPIFFFLPICFQSDRYVMDDPYDSYVQQYYDVSCPKRDDGGVQYAIDTVDPVLAFVKNATWATTRSAIYDSDAVRLDSIINVSS